MSAAIRTSGEATRPGQFVVASRSTPGHAWTVFWQTFDVSFCGCPRFALTGQCRHVEAAALAIEVEARQAVSPERRAEAAQRLAQIEQEFAL